jgi:glycosyltransferase involved in cell wall biosynthesis
MAESQSKRLLVCEEALKNHEGHWYEYNKAVAEINRNRGVDVSILAHQEVDESICEELNARPFFDFTNWDQIYNFQQAWKRYLGIIRHNIRVYRAMAKHFSSSEKYDCVFVPTVVIFHLPAWVLLARRFGGKKAGRIVLLIRNSATEYHGDSSEPVFKRSTSILAWVLRRYRPLIKKEIVCLASDSHRLALEYKKLASVDLAVFPHPRSAEALAVEAEVSKSKDKIIMSSLGPARWEKGIQLLIEAIKTLAASHDIPNIHFIIQWNQDVIAPDGSVLTLDRESLQNTSVSCEILARPLTSKEYNSILVRSDCLLLPYLRQAYFARISGVAVEGMMTGKPLIYTRDTWVADIAEDFGAGASFQDNDAKDLAEKIIQVARDLSTIQTQAQERAPLAIGYFSPENFYNSLWEA